MSATLLFLYGPSGSGKTRLLQMIAEILQGVQSVMRVGSEQLVDEMRGSGVDFFDRYALIENLLIDNLWILRSRPAATKEMGRLIEARMNYGNLTVLASDLTKQDVIRAFPAIGKCLEQDGAIHLNMTRIDRGVNRWGVSCDGELIQMPCTRETSKTTIWQME